jgi:hypothetical protein
VLFASSTGVRQAWQTITMSASRPMLTVVDAVDGRVLFRQPLSSDAYGASPVHAPVTWKHLPGAVGAETDASKAKRHVPRGLAFKYFPRSKRGGHAVPVNFYRKDWLKRKARILSGNNSHTFSDVDADDKPGKGEEVRAKKHKNWNYRLKPFHLKGVSFCGKPYPCSWNPNKPFSWRVNREQNGTQVFYFVNNWHDWLKKKPIGFTEAAGNFQKVNKSGKGKGHDAVNTQTDDGANTDHGLPDGNHIDNANMSTPPDGRAPRMQMYLQHAPFTNYPNRNGVCADPCDEFSPTNVGDEADTVYHEYTHGLSNRLVVDAAGRSTLGPVQAGAMGEAWSDWYAMDYLVKKKLQQDKKDKVDVVLFQYDGFGVFLDRTEPMDCKVGKNAPRCTGGSTGHGGGYTYADYGSVVPGPEVHSDGEIWGQTLWDLRNRIGSRNAEALVTRAMELAPHNPSFLDMRNAILLADRAINHGKLSDKIWKVFAHRGMGYFAGSLGGNDTAPGASFATPPAGHKKGTVSGVVTDSVTDEPIRGARVTIAFQGTPAIFNPTTRTAADGSYTLGPVPRGKYPKMTISFKGYDLVTRRVNVDAKNVTKNVQADRNWASFAGGGRITDFSPPDFGPPCGPKNAIDQSATFGWSTLSDLRPNGTPSADTPKHFVVKLPEAVDITSITVNPTAICGDGLSASTGRYTVEVRQAGGSFTEAGTDTFEFGELGGPSEVPLSGSPEAIRFVRFTIEAPIVTVDTEHYPEGSCPGGGFSGCDFEDVTEVSVYGEQVP